MIPEGWKIERKDDPPFMGYRITAPNGYTAEVYSHERNPENVLYMLAKTLLNQDQRALTALRALEPYLDGIICYASTQGEYEPNRIAAQARAVLAASAADAAGVATVDPADPGYDVATLREHVRHLERRIRELHAERKAAGPMKAGQDTQSHDWREGLGYWQCKRCGIVSQSGQETACTGQVKAGQEVPTDDEIVAWADNVIRKVAFNRSSAVLIAIEAAKWVRSRCDPAAGPWPYPKPKG